MSSSKSPSESSNAKPDPQECLFLTRLPAEIRDNIYQLVLPSPTTLSPKVHTLFKAAERRERTGAAFRTHERVLGLARTCTQIFNEVIPIYFGENRFWFDNAYDLYRYLYMIGIERRRWIKSIEVFLRGVTYWQFGGKVMPNREVFQLAFDILADCFLLNKLYLGVCFETTEGTKYPHNDLMVVRSTGVFDALRGLENLDLRVRYVYGWYPDLGGDIFEMEIGEALRVLSQTPLFGARHLEEFERVLGADMRAPRGGCAVLREDKEFETGKKEHVPQSSITKGKRKINRVLPWRIVKKRATKRKRHNAVSGGI